MAEPRQGSPLGFGGREWATTINISCKLVCCILSPVQWTEWTICKFKSPYFSVHLDGRFTSLPRHPWSEPWKISAKLLGTKKINWVLREMCPFLRIYKFLVGYNTHRRLTLRYLLELYLCYTYTAVQTRIQYISHWDIWWTLFPRLFGLPPLTFIVSSPFISYIVTATIYIKYGKFQRYLVVLNSSTRPTFNSHYLSIVDSWCRDINNSMGVARKIWTNTAVHPVGLRRATKIKRSSSSISYLIRVL